MLFSTCPIRIVLICICIIDIRFLESLKMNSSAPIEGVTAYERLTETLRKAFESAKNASNYADETSEKVKKCI